MSGYSRRRVACRHAREQKKASELEEGECAQSEIQHRPQASMCDLPKIQLSALSQSSCPYVAERFEFHPVPVEDKPADPNIYKLLSKTDVQYISLDADTVSISSDESDCDIREICAWSSENVSTTKAGNIDGKNQNNFLSNDLTEESRLSNEPKLSVSPAVPSSTSTLQSCEDNTTKTDLIEIDTSQTHSTSSSLQNNAGANSIHTEPNKLQKIRTRSLVYLKQKEIETLSKDSDLHRESSSSVSRSPEPSVNQSKSNPEQSIENKLSSKEFCCVLSWLTCIYGKPLQCLCTFPAGAAKPGQNYATRSSFSLSQLNFEREPYKDVNNTTNAVQNGSTSTPQRCEKPIQNKQEIHTYILKDSSGVGRRKSKTSQLSEGENCQAKITQEPVLNSVLQLKTLRTCNESTNLLGSQKKAQNADIQPCTGNEEEINIPVDSDILSISSNESDSDIMETGVLIPENVSHDLLPKQDISQIPMVQPKYVKSCTNANVSKADRSKNILNNDGEKNSTQSEQNKLSVNLGGSFYVSPKQTDALIGESIVHTQCSSSILYQDTGPEPPKKNSESTFKVKDNIHNDSQDATFIDEVVQDTQIEEQNPLRPENKIGSDDKFENESAEAGCVHDNVVCVACNEKLCEVREEDSLTSSIEEIPEQSPASEQQVQSLPVGDQEYQFNWTDQLSEIITQFPLGIHDVNTDKPSLDKETAVIGQEGYSNEVIDRCLDNFEDLIKQFDASFLCNDRNNYELHCAKPSDNGSNDKTSKKVQKDTCNKQFCCMLSWSAYVCGEQTKCLCTTNLRVDGEICSQISHPSCKVNFPLIKKTKTSTEKKDTRTAGLRSRPELKTQGNLSEKFIQKNWKSKEYISGNRSGSGRKKRKRANINLEGECKWASTAKNSRSHNTRIAKQLDRKKKDHQTNIQFHKGKAQPPPLSKMTDTAPGLVQCNSSLPHVQNTAAAENKPNTHVKKKRKSKKKSRKNKQNEHNQCTPPVEHEQNVLEKSTIHVQESSFLDRIRQLRQRTKMAYEAELSGKVLELSKTRLCSRSIWNTQHIEGLQLLPEKEDQIGYPKEPTIENNLDLQSKMCSPDSQIVTGTRPSNNTCDRAIDVVKQNITRHSQQLGQPELNDCVQLSDHKRKPTGKKTQYTKLGRPEPEVFSETIETLASPKLDVMKSNTDDKKRQPSKVSSKYVDSAQFYLKKVEQGSLIQLCKNPFVKLISSEQEVKENQLKTCQKTQVSSEKSVTTVDTRGTFPDLETKTFSQLRKLDVEQELPKDNYSLVNEVNKHTSSLAKQNGTDLHLLPAVQKLTEEKHQEIVSEDRQDSKKQSQSKKQCFPTKALRRRSTSRRKSHSPGLDEQNTSVETSDAPSPSVCRVESSMNRDESKEGTEKDKPSTCNLKRDQAVTKLIPNIFVHERTTSGRSHLDLQTETVSHLDSQQKISKNDHGVVEDSNEEATPAMQKAKFSDKYEKCAQKLEYELNLGHEGKKRTPRQRKRKTNNPASERDSSKRRKSGVSNRKAVSDEEKPTCTREPSPNLEKPTRCLLTHINAATVSSICDISVSKEVIEASIPNQDIGCINQPLNEKSQESSYLSNNHYLDSDSTELNWKKQGMEADVLKDKLTVGLYRNQISCEPYVPLERIKATVSSSLPVLKKSTEKLGIEQDTILTDNLNCPLEKMASQRSDTAVKVPEASCCDRPTGQSTLKEKTYVRRCVLRLWRLPLPLERQYLLDNTRETGKEHK